MASIKSLGGDRYRIFLCRTKPDGTLERPSKIIQAKSMADARRQANAIESDFRRSPFEPSASTTRPDYTFDDIVQEWRKVEAPKLAVKTYERYEGFLRSHLLPRFGSQKLNEIRPADIQSYLSSLSCDGVRKDTHPGGYSQKTIRDHYVFLQLLFSFALKMEYIDTTPFYRLKPPKVDKKETRFLDPHGIERLVAALNQMRDETESSFASSIKYSRMDAGEAERRQQLRRLSDHLRYIYTWLALVTGARRSELCGLMWSDIDFENMVIHIRRTLQYAPSKGIYTVPKLKNGSPLKLLPVPSKIIDMLTSYKIEEERLIATMGWPNSGYLFISLKGTSVTTPGGPIMPDTISQWFTGFIQKYGINQITLHGLRHSCISYLLNNGVPIEVAASIAGHSSTSTTREIYEHIYPQAKREGVQPFDKLLNDVC